MTKNNSTSNSGNRGKRRTKFARDRSNLSGALNKHNQDFRCGHCQNLVSANYLIAGVKNRNHCPFCLWSKHVDSREAGDRLAACKGLMKPVGLTLKKTRKKYGPETGELMFIHECVECGKISINRIAADDDNERIFEVFEESFVMEPTIKTRLDESGIETLREDDAQIVRTQLLGANFDEE